MDIIKEFLFWPYPRNEEFLWILLFCSILGMIAFLSMFKELKAMQEQPEVEMSDESIKVILDSCNIEFDSK